MTTTQFPSQVPCTHCGRPLYSPRWRYVGDGEYEALCGLCIAWQDHQFTEDQVLCHAIIIIGMHQGMLRSAGVK